MQRIFIVLLVLCFSSAHFPGQAHSANPTAGSKAALQGQTVEGAWEGTLSVGGNNLRFVLKVSRGVDGALKATMDSLDQPGGMNLKVDTIAFKDAALHFEMKDLYVVYDGTSNRDGSGSGGYVCPGGKQFPAAV